MGGAEKWRGRGRRAWWQWAAALVLAAALLYKSLQGVDWAVVWQTVVRARAQFLAAGALLSVVSYGLRAARWRILLNAGSAAPLPYGMVFRANTAGYLGNAVLPARAGEVIRSLMISGQAGLPAPFVLTTALGERLLDAIVLVVCGSVALVRVPSTPAWIGDGAKVMAVAAGGGALALAALPHAEAHVHWLAERMPAPRFLKLRIRGLVEQVLLALRAFHHLGRLARFAALTAAIWTIDSVAAITVGRGLGLHLSPTAAILLMAAMGLGSALPSTPGYVGIYQFVTVTVLGPFGIGRDAALAYSLVMQALAYLVIAVLGAASLYRFLAPGSKSGEQQN